MARPPRDDPGLPIKFGPCSKGRRLHLLRGAADQIQAFRSFQISEQFQERYGYPKLTKEIKEKVLGLNGARVYGIDPTTVPCKLTRRELEQVRSRIKGRHATHGPRNAAEVARLREHHQGWPG